VVGRYNIEITYGELSYQFTISRNLTVIKGNSGTGKTTLYDAITEYNRYLGLVENVYEQSGIKIKINGKALTNNSDVKLISYSDQDVNNIQNTIVLIDELDVKFKFKSIENIVQKKDCYFIIITRRSLASLSYSVEEIYTLNTKIDKLCSKMTSLLPMYSSNKKLGEIDLLIIEDSKSGYEFFSKICKPNTVISGSSKSTITKFITKSLIPELIVKETVDYTQLVQSIAGVIYSSVGIIIDAAAFGYNIEEIYNLHREIPTWLRILTPESFEWLMLNSTLFTNDKYVQDRIEAPYNYADSKLYISWEKFFTEVLDHSYRSIFKISYKKGRKLDSRIFDVDTVNSILSKLNYIDFNNILNEKYKENNCSRIETEAEKTSHFNKSK
jgi:hypothetical protein